MKKKIIALILAVLIAGGAGGYFYMSSTGDNTSGSASGSVPVMAVSDLQSSASASFNRYSGVVETQKKKSITLDSEKTVADILVSEGDQVHENDALFTYDTEKTLLEISQKELSKEKLNTDIAGMTEQINQLNTELNKGNLSSADRMNYNAQIMEKQTNIAQAQYDLKVADSEIAALNAAVKNSTVRSPIAGTVESVEDPSAMSDPTAAFITITPEGDFRIKGTFSEQNMGDIYEGLRMLVRSRIDEDKTWTGTVTAIETTQEEDSSQMYYGMDSSDSASKYAFYVTLDSKEDLMLGQHVTLEQLQEEQMEGLVLSTGYLAAEEDGSIYIYAVSEPGGRLEKRLVEIGEVYPEADMVQILSGISEEDYVAWPDNDDCQEGAATSAAGFAEDSLLEEDDI